MFGFFVRAEVVCQCVCMTTERQVFCFCFFPPGRLASTTTGEQANECLNKNQGRTDGGQGVGEGKMHPCTVGGWTRQEAYALIQLLSDFVNA